MTNLESIIKTTFKNEQDKALVNVLYSGNHINQLLTNLTRGFKLKPTHFHILQILKQAQGIPLSFESIKSKSLDMHSLNPKHFDKLVEMACIQKLEDKIQNLLLFRITDKGMKLITTMESKTIEYLDPLKNRLNPQEARTLNYILDKMRG